MKKRLQLEDKRISYTLRKSNRARRMRLAVYCDGSIVVTAPSDLGDSVIEKFIKDKANWLLSKLTFFKSFKGYKFTRQSHSDYLRYKEQAYEIAVRRVEHFNQVYGFKYNNINIKNQKTRWGSCSKKGNLNFNYKIALLPQNISDYIIVHELCHLGQFNHSKKFWSLVGKTITNYQGIREDMKSLVK